MQIGIDLFMKWMADIEMRPKNASMVIRKNKLLSKLLAEGISENGMAVQIVLIFRSNKKPQRNSEIMRCETIFSIW